MKRNHRLSRLFLFPVLLALLCIGDLTLIEVQDPKGLPKTSTRHILIITSQPNVTQRFTPLNNSLAEILSDNLTAQTKLNYEYLDNTNIGCCERRTLFCIFQKYRWIG